jgi:uncharacterized protein YyaL (SSP411 family)
VTDTSVDTSVDTRGAVRVFVWYEQISLQKECTVSVSTSAPKTRKRKPVSVSSSALNPVYGQVQPLASNTDRQSGGFSSAMVYVNSTFSQILARANNIAS